MRKARILAIAILPVTLAACGGGPNEDDRASSSAPSPAASSAISSARAPATCWRRWPALVGGIVGSEIGRSMDEQDRRLAQQAEFDALEAGESDRPRRWRNPDNGRYGDVVPGRPYKRSNIDCRDYTHTVYIDGRPRKMRGTACRNPDGTWRNVALTATAAGT